MSARTTVAARLHRKRAWARLVLWTERLVPAVAPAAIVVAAFACLAMLGFIAQTPPLLRLAIPAVAIIATAGSAGIRLGRIVAPSAAAIDRHLERNQPHRPLTTLSDRPAAPGGELLWQAHRERAIALVARLQPGPPRLPRSAAWSLLAAALLVTGSITIAGRPALPRLWAALTPAWPARTPGSGTLDAWIVPPPADGLAPIFLHPGSAPITVPDGAELTVASTGAAARPHLTYGPLSQPFRRLENTHFQTRLTLHTSGTLEVWRAGERIARWIVQVAPDQPPRIHIAGAAGQTDGRLRLPWQASDDYGLAGITAELRRTDRPAAAGLTLATQLPGHPREAEGGLLPDLTAHPWAGLPLRLRYVARDVAGQIAATADVPVMLPERAFLNPLARALIVVRRGLVIDPTATVPAVAALDRVPIASLAEVSAPAWLNLRAIAALLTQQHAPSAQAVARLWQLAVQIEDGGTTDAKQRLADARKALSDALAAQPSAASASQLAALNQALQQAIAQYLQALTRQAAQSGQAPPQAGQRSIDAGQLQQMTSQLAEAAAAGRLADARQRLQQLGALLDSLRAAGPNPAGTTDSAEAQAHQDPAVAALLAAQAALRRHTVDRLDGNVGPGTPTRGPPPAPTSGAPDPARQRAQDATTQSSLRTQLGALASTLGEQTGRVPAGLAQADRAMRQASEALGRGDDAAARTAQERAIEGLRASGSTTTPGPEPAPGSDPLGRPLAQGGGADQSDVTLPSEADGARGRALRDELRRRGADRTRPQPELDYIDRLLNAP